MNKLRSYTCFFCLLCFSVVAWGQNIKGGVSAGLNLTQIEGDNTHGFYNLGPNAGGIAVMPLSTKFTLSLELLYTHKGSTTLKADDIDFAKSYDLTLHYVEMPLLFNYHDKQRVNFGAGIALGALVRAKEVIKEPALNYQDKYPYNSIDYTLVINGNYLIFPKLSFNLRWSYSILPIRENPPAFNKEVQLNHVVSVRLTYYFNQMFNPESNDNVDF